MSSSKLTHPSFREAGAHLLYLDSHRPRVFGLLLGTLTVEVAAFSAADLAAQEQPEEPSTADLTEQIGPGNEDRVETIGTEESPRLPEAAAPIPGKPLETGSRVQLSGFARESLELVYGELARRTGSDPPGMSGSTGDTTKLWRDVFTSHGQLFLRASYLKSQHYEATVSGVLGYTLHVAKEAPVFSVGVVDLTRGEVEAQLRDAYVGFFWPSIDLRIGQQRVAWGKADFQSPNDVVNARDLRDPFLGETELRYLPTTLVRSSVSSGPVTFEVVVSPFFVPDRFDVYGSNWAAVQRLAPDKLEDFLGSASILSDASVEREVASLWRQTERPTDNGKGLSAGARLSASLSGTDLSAYYHYGYDSTPFVTVSPGFLDYLDATTFTSTDARGNVSADPSAAKFGPLLTLRDNMARAGSEPFSSRYLRRHHVGLDLASVLGPVVVRVDAAYETRRVYYYAPAAPDAPSMVPGLSSLATPTLLGVFGLEYQTGNLDDTILLELLGARLLRQPEAPLLAYEQTTVAVAGTLRWTLGESWGIDLRGLGGIQPKTYALQPALRFKPTDDFSLRLGALLVGGEANSFGWYYGDNDTAFVQIRYAF